MTNPVQIAISTEGARRLRKLLDSTDGGSVGTVESEAVEGGSSVVVRLLAAISAGSTAAVDAEIMTLSGNTWTGTGQLVPGGVRSVTGLAVTTTGRRIARKVSRWGYCVVET